MLEGSHRQLHLCQRGPNLGTRYLFSKRVFRVMYLEPSTNYGDNFDLHKVIGNKFYRFHGVWDGYEEIIARYLLTLIID